MAAAFSGVIMVYMCPVTVVGRSSWNLRMSSNIVLRNAATSMRRLQDMLHSDTLPQHDDRKNPPSRRDTETSRDEA